MPQARTKETFQYTDNYTWSPKYEGIREELTQFIDDSFQNGKLNSVLDERVKTIYRDGVKNVLFPRNIYWFQHGFMYKLYSYGFLENIQELTAMTRSIQSISSELNICNSFIKPVMQGKREIEAKIEIFPSLLEDLTKNLEKEVVASEVVSPENDQGGGGMVWERRFKR